MSHAEIRGYNARDTFVLGFSTAVATSNAAHNFYAWGGDGSASTTEDVRNTTILTTFDVVALSVRVAGNDLDVASTAEFRAANANALTVTITALTNAVFSNTGRGRVTSGDLCNFGYDGTASASGDAIIRACLAICERI